MSVLHSANAPRKERCSQILRHAQQSLATGGANHNQRGALTAIITAMQQLVKSFLEMAAMKIDNPGSISMSTHFPALKAMVPCEIIIPLQNAMTVTFPTDEKVFAHKPFPSNLVTFQAFRDEVDIMSSVAKPRKIVIIGSDGKTYRFLCKPMDDLRKDNRFNECTSLIGKLLRKDADARKRGLCDYSFCFFAYDVLTEPPRYRHSLIRCYSTLRDMWIDRMGSRYARYTRSLYPMLRTTRHICLGMHLCLCSVELATLTGRSSE